MKIIISEGTTLFHGTSKENLKLESNPMWLAYNKQIATNYSNGIVHEFKVKKSLKTIDIMSLEFHNNYIDNLNRTFTGDNYNGLDERKLKLCIPLGLPNYDIQSKWLEENNIQYAHQLPNYTKHEDVLMKYSGMYKNRHRFSTRQFDQEMIAILKYFYPEYDGYSSLVSWPSKIHGGLFNPEICLFYPNRDLEFVKTHNVKRGAGKQIGGGSDVCPIIVNGDTWNRMCNGITKEEWANIYNSPLWKGILKPTSDLKPQSNPKYSIPTIYRTFTQFSQEEWDNIYNSPLWKGIKIPK